MTIANSVLMVGIISVVSAVVGALYTFIVSLTSKGAKKVVAPILSASEPEPDPEPEMGAEPDVPSDGFRKKMRSVIVYPALFLLVSVLTIATSWSIASAAEGDVKIFRTESSQSLSESDRQELLDEAASLAPESERVVVEREVVENVVETPTQPQGAPEIDVGDLSDSGVVFADDMERELASLREENAALRERLDVVEKLASSGEGGNQELMDLLAALQGNIDDLERRLAAIESGGESAPQVLYER